MDNNGKIKTNIIPEALFLLVLTAGAYWLSFKYESAYFSAFQLPIQLIDVSATLLLTTFVVLSGAIYFLFSVLNLVLMTFPENPIIQNKVARISLAMVLPIWYLMAYGFRKADLKIYIIVILLIVFFEFLWPLLVYKNKKTLNERIIADENAEDKVRSKTIPGRIFNKFGSFYYLIFFFFWFASSLVSIYGEARAKTQSIYPVDINDSNVAVVRMYNDKFVCIRYDSKDKKIKSYFVREAIGNEYRNENIGPLNLDLIK